jgi:hypothetical protein
MSERCRPNNNITVFPLSNTLSKLVSPSSHDCRTFLYPSPRLKRILNDVVGLTETIHLHARQRDSKVAHRLVSCELGRRRPHDPRFSRISDRSCPRRQYPLRADSQEWGCRLSSRVVPQRFCHVCSFPSLILFLTSLPVSIGDWYPERSFFQILIALTSGPRFTLVFLQYYLQRQASRSSWPFVLLIVGVVRSLSCGGWVYVTSTDHHDAHDALMLSYIICNVFWMFGSIYYTPSVRLATKQRRFVGQLQSQHLAHV